MPICTHGLISKGFWGQQLVVVVDPPSALVTCMFSVSPGVSWSSALCCLKGRVTGSEDGPVPQAEAPRLALGWILTSFGRAALSPSPQACFSLLGELLLYSFELLCLL